LPLLLIAILGFGKRREGLKYRSLIEGFVFLMFGPLLTLGFQYSFGGGFDLEVLFIGLLTGWFAVYQVHIKNFSQIVLASKVGFRNSVTKWGFDRSKKILSLWWLAFIVFLILYHQIYSNNEWFIINVILLVGMSVPVVLAFFRLQASLGSRCERTVTIASKVSQMALALWVLEAFWSFLQVEIF
jgi:1,4-dihydroxy-2-naphthoate octaprenyltransferase